MRSGTRIRKARSRSSVFAHDNRCKSAEAVPALLERDGPGCFYCGTRPPAYQVDHVRSRTRGGGDDIENLVLACSPCNIEKFTHPAWLFALYHGAGIPLPQRLIEYAPPVGEADDWLNGSWADELVQRLAETKPFPRTAPLKEEAGR